jgi:hypothetical protein
MWEKNLLPFSAEILFHVKDNIVFLSFIPLISLLQEQFYTPKKVWKIEKKKKNFHIISILL